MVHLYVALNAAVGDENKLRRLFVKQMPKLKCLYTVWANVL